MKSQKHCYLNDLNNDNISGNEDANEKDGIGIQCNTYMHTNTHTEMIIKNESINIKRHKGHWKCW